MKVGGGPFFIVFDSFWGGLFGGELKNYNSNNRLYY